MTLKEHLQPSSLRIWWHKNRSIWLRNEETMGKCLMRGTCLVMSGSYLQDNSLSHTCPLLPRKPISHFHTLPAFSRDVVIKSVRTWLETALIPTRGTTSWHSFLFDFLHKFLLQKKKLTLICTPKIWKKVLIARLRRSCAEILRPQFCRREREKFCREFQVSNVEQICLREQ